MKRIFFTIIFSIGLALSVNGLSVGAVVNDEVFKEQEITSYQAVASYLSPSNLSGRSHTYYNLTVSTNVRGIARFTFDPGITGQKPRSANGSVSRVFSQSWSTNGLKTFRTGAQVISQEYGPAPWFYGKAVISY